MRLNGDAVKRIQDVMIGIFISILVAAAIYAYKTLRPSLPSILATPAKELAKEETKTLKDKPVVVYREKVKAKLGLPESIKKDATKHVVNSTQVEASDRPTTVTAVYDDQTGVVDLFKRQDRLPWLAFYRRYEIGLSWLPLTDKGGSAVMSIDGRIELLQAKALRFGVTGTMSEQAGDFHWQVGVRTWANF